MPNEEVILDETVSDIVFDTENGNENAADAETKAVFDNKVEKDGDCDDRIEFDSGADCDGEDVNTPEFVGWDVTTGFIDSAGDAKGVIEKSIDKVRKPEIVARLEIETLDDSDG